MVVAGIVVLAGVGFITFVMWALCKAAGDNDDEMHRDDLD